MAKAMWMAAVVIVAALGFAPRSAQALSVNVPVSGITVVGVTAGQTWLGVQPWAGGPCQFAWVGSAALTDRVDLFGTSGSDYITVLRSNLNNFCGYNWTPLNPNGRVIYIMGGGGDDNLIAGPGVVALFGEGGNDVIQMNRDRNAMGDGGSGYDRIIGYGWSQDIMVGGTEDDLLCQPPTSNTKSLEGGAGRRDFQRRGPRL